MDWTELGKNIVKIGAPLLGGVIGGPAGASIGGLLASTLGCDDNPAEILNKIQSDPQSINKLMEFQLNHQLELERITFQHAELEFKDRKSARAREIELRQKGEKDYTPKILAFLVTLGFFGSIILVAFVNIPVAAKEVIFLLMGALAANFNQIISYYFGSSSSSKQKNDLLVKRN